MTRDDASATATRVNLRLAALLEETRSALRGECDFNVEDVRRLGEPVAEMASIVAQSNELQRRQPEIAEHLQRYKSHLVELQTMLLQVRVMLLSRQASLQASQLHTTSVSRWASTVAQTL
jgi:hypothetical protein